MAVIWYSIAMTVKTIHASKKALPISWTRAAGLLRKHTKSLTEHGQQVRTQWRDRYGN